LGFLLLLPPTRALFRRVLVNRLGRRLVIGGRRPDGARQSYDVEGSATEYNNAPPPRLGQ
jgi:UPF0716 family protein affecting phage T7 exclusion